MSRFFINRPIVAIVLAILMTIVGIVAMIQLPISQYPATVPPEIQVRANYTGAMRRRSSNRSRRRSSSK